MTRQEEEHEEHEEANRGADTAAERRLERCYQIVALIREAELKEYRYGHK